MRKKSQCVNTYRWKQNNTFVSHTLFCTHTHLRAHTAPPTDKAPPSPVCIAPKRAASFPSPFFIIQAKETQQHPATSYSHALLSSLSFLFLWHRKIAYYREQGFFYVCCHDYTPRTWCFLVFVEPSLWRCCHFICRKTSASLHVYCSTVHMSYGLLLLCVCVGGWVRGYCDSMRWISILFTPLFTTNCWGLQCSSN